MLNIWMGSSLAVLGLATMFWGLPSVLAFIVRPSYKKADAANNGWPRATAGAILTVASTHFLFAVPEIVMLVGFGVVFLIWRLQLRPIRDCIKAEQQRFMLYITHGKSID
jgi:hypothetical protein